MTELKLCPFCGGEAHTYKNNLWHVACERAHNGCVTMSAFITEAEAVEAWNNRTLGGGECELVYGENDHGDDGWWCQSCGGWFAASFRHTGRNNIIEPSYCQHCGKAVKR